MPKIERQIEILASKDRVWDIVSDLENEPEYWYGTKKVRTISKNGNAIDREITQNFRNHKITQKVTLNPKESIEVLYLKGLTEGTKLISIESLDEHRQLLRILWNVHYTGIYYLLTPYLRGHTDKGTVSALERIKEASERMELEQRDRKEKIDT